MLPNNFTERRAKMQRIYKELIPSYFDPASDDQVKMRENVRHKKIARTIGNLKKINTQNAGVNDFLPSWATNEYFDSLHEKKATEKAKTKVDIDEVKKYVGEIIVKAREKLLKEAAALKVPQVLQDSKALKKKKMNDYTNNRMTMDLVHRQPLDSSNSETNKLNMDNCEKIRAKTEQMMAIHAELKKMVILKGLCLEDGDTDDGCFVPRKLFLFEIQDFRKTTQIMEIPNTQIGDNDPPNISEESVTNHSGDLVSPSKQKRRSLGRRFLRFLGFRNTA